MKHCQPMKKRMEIPPHAATWMRQRLEDIKWGNKVVTVDKYCVIPLIKCLEGSNS